MKKPKHTEAQRYRRPSRAVEQLERRVLLAADIVPADTMDLGGGHFWGDGHDHSADWTELRIGPSGKAVYHDPAEPQAASPHDPGCCCPDCAEPVFHGTNHPVEIIGDGERVGLDQIPVLHSNPGAPNVFYLDFNGQVIADTDWNVDRAEMENRGKPIHAPAYSTDDDPTTFNQIELDAIFEVWQRVSEDFLPFNIDITTEEPPESAFRNGRGAIRAIITTPVDDAAQGGAGSEWYLDAGGVAYNSSYLWPGDIPIWVFHNKIPRTTKAIAEATSHEFGHALGLGHRGVNGAEYHNGHGLGETSWAPIMGAGYTKNVTQWTDGRYAGGSSSGNGDLEIMTDPVFHVSFREDDHAQANDEASPLELTRGRLYGDGIIETQFDYDVFSFDHSGGALELIVSPAAVGPNLDIVIELYDTESVVPVATSAPRDSLSASLDLDLASGRYFVLVDGGGRTPANGEGFSDYGSLGGYTIDGFLGESEITAIAGGPYRIDEGELLRLDAGLSYSPSQPLAYDWDIDGDGDYQDAAGRTVLLTWEELGQLPNPIDDQGVYEVSLRVTDAVGDVDQHTVPLTVRNVAPQVELAGPSISHSFGPTQFVVTATDILNDPLHYEWNFGDGSEPVTGTDTVMDHLFQDPGVYDVAVVAYDDDGAATTVSVQVEVISDPPVVVSSTFIDGAVLGLVDRAVFDFSQDVSQSLAPSSLTIIDSLTNDVIDPRFPEVIWDAENNRATFAVGGLAPGQYRVVLGGVENKLGLVLDGDHDGLPSGIWAVDVIVTFPGDANRDLTVDFEDFSLFAAQFGKQADWSGGDFTGDGVVTFDDFIELTRHFGLTLHLDEDRPAS